MSQNDKILDHLQKVGSISFLKPGPCIVRSRPAASRISAKAGSTSLVSGAETTTVSVTSATASSSDGGAVEQHDERETNVELCQARRLP